MISLFTFFSEFTAHSCQRMTNDEETPNTEAVEKMVLAKPPDVVYVFKLSQAGSQEATDDPPSP